MSKHAAQIKRLQTALDAATDVGIYPLSFDGRYKKRTRYMEGWNGHSRAAIKAAIKELKPGDWNEI